MVNCNPETVSTDYDTSDRLYFEPLTLEDVLEVVARRAAGRPDRGRHRAARRPDPARAGAGARGRGRADRRHLARVRSTSPRTAAPSAGCCARPGCPRPQHGTATSLRRGARRSPTRSATRCWCARPTCSAGAAWRSSTTTTTLARLHRAGPPRSAPSTRCWSTASSTTRSRSTSTRSTTAPSCTSAASWSTSRRPASTPATRPARCRRSRSARPRSSGSATPPRRSPEGVGVRGLINIQFAAGPGRSLYVLEANPRAVRTVPFVSKATGVPLAKAAARVMLGATIAELRAEGMLPATGDGGTLPAHAPIAVKEAVLPFKRFRTRTGTGRHAARPGDALDRRGHGHRRRLRHGVRQGAGGGVRRAAAPGHGVRVGRQPRQARA